MSAPKPLNAGEKAPSFTFIENGQTVRSDELTSPYLVYFYPKDDTPGCTKEACAIRDTWGEFKFAGLKVIGVSKDSEKSHDKFRDKYSLPFPLVPDTELELAKAFGVFGEKKFMGRVSNSVHRMSFLIGADGTVMKSYPKVKPDEHAAEVLKDFAKLNG